MSEVPAQHVVKAGEQHLPRIARDHGFRAIEPVWDAPENAELRGRRVNPNTLAAGDVVVIPADDPETADRSAGQVHQFTVIASALHLVLRLQDEGRRPLANRAIRFVAGATSTDGKRTNLQPIVDFTTDANGMLNLLLATRSTEAELTVHTTSEATSPVAAQIRIMIGALDPASTESGQRSRLNNMGYFAGFSPNDTAQLQWAIEEFERDHDLRVTGRSDVPATFNRIAHEHGDLLASETVP